MPQGRSTQKLERVFRAPRSLRMPHEFLDSEDTHLLASPPGEAKPV